jgi:hypothetical protein
MRRFSPGSNVKFNVNYLDTKRASERRTGTTEAPGTNSRRAPVYTDDADSKCENCGRTRRGLARIRCRARREPDSVVFGVFGAMLNPVSGCASFWAVGEGWSRVRGGRRAGPSVRPSLRSRAALRRYPPCEQRTLARGPVWGGLEMGAIAALLMFAARRQQLTTQSGHAVYAWQQTALRHRVGYL